jgi:hypothetical protein
VAADAQLKFHFSSTTSWPLTFLDLPFGPLITLLASRRARGSLPLTKRWRVTLIGFRWGAVAAAAVALVGLFSVNSMPPPLRSWTLGIGFVGLTTYLVNHLIYAALRPRGVVRTSTDGQLLVDLSNVHANFAAAVEAMRSSTQASQANEVT